ncbi:YcbK family protein [Sabulicella rubraurantiaca]|uniref:YcbK family protein n=1 Tax=Sabulicella rubraurantiaca TaxID=2811429 RepID=UPI001A964CE1|nr:DUF882 domain-containing protein [Sabulicella rubraurantiaca]
MFGRRAILAGLTGAAPLLLSNPGAAQSRRPAASSEVRRLAVQFTHTGAWFRGPFRNEEGHDPKAIEEFSEVMRDWRTGEVKQFDPAVLDLLWRLGREARVSEFSVLSGYRSPRTNAAVGGVPGSQHLSARALDIWLPAGRLGTAIEKAVAMRAGGVGAYSGWMHLDTGAVRFWDQRHGGTGGPEPEAILAVRAPAGREPARGGPTTLARGRQWMVIEPLERQAQGGPIFPAPRILNLR